MIHIQSDLSVMELGKFSERVITEETPIFSGLA